MDVAQGLVFVLLLRGSVARGMPPFDDLLERAHVDVAVMKELVDLRKVENEEQAVVPHRVPAERSGLGRDVLSEERERASLAFGTRDRRGPDAIEESRLSEGIPRPVRKRPELLFRRVKDERGPFRDQVQV